MAQKKSVWHRKRVKTPTLLQMEAVECGAACLGMILSYWGRWVPLESLRIECGVSRDGSKASNILKAARKFGMVAKGFRKEPKNLHELRLPMILFWNFNHFVVLEGIKGEKVYLNDPAHGPRVIALEEFDQSFTGVALSFEPGPDFKKGGKKPTILGSLARRFTGSFPALCFTILTALFLIIPGVVIPVFSRVFVDNILVGHMDGWIKPLFMAMTLTFVVQSGLTWLQEYYLLRQETRMALTSSAKFFHHVFQLPVTFFAQRFPGDIGQRVQSNRVVAQILSGDLTSSIINLFSITFFAGIMLFYDAMLTGIGIAIAMLNLLLLRYVQNKQVMLNQRQMQEQAKLTSTTMGGLQMIETLKASGGESDFFALWSGHHAKALNAQQQLGARSLFMTAMPPFLSTLTNLSILVVGGFRVMDGHLTMGELVAFQSLMGRFLGPVTAFTQLGQKLQQVKGDMNRLDDVLLYKKDRRFSRPENNDINEAFSSKTRLSGEVEIKNLTFGYSPLDPPLIENFQMHIKPGKSVALVGRSGSGKSTIARLLAGLCDPWEGEILFDGIPSEKIPRRLGSNSISMVDQEIFIFEGTIRENISMWDSTIPNARIVKAAGDAAIHGEISAKPGGYDGPLAEGGWNFSGGQCQRLEIARALVTDPAILIMDEATSALDANTEKKVADSIRKRKCSCIIVAHRLSTIRDCDHIIVMEQGKIVQQGSHKELVDTEGLYSTLITME